MFRSFVSLLLGAAVFAASTGVSPAFEIRFGRKVGPEISELLLLAAEPLVPLSTVFKYAERLGVGFSPATMAGQAKPPKSARKEGKLRTSLAPIDLVLAQLAFQTGANYHLALRQAQDPAKLHVLVLEHGTATLEQLAASLAGTDREGLLEVTPDGIVAHVPLAVWTDATLLVDDGPALVLDRAAGAFLVAAGRLVVRGGTITSSQEVNSRQPDFRPFVLVALSGAAEIQDTRFENLGFGEHRGMTGLSFLQGGLYARGALPIVRDSIFVNTGSLSLGAAQGGDISGNRFVGTRGSAILIEGGRDVNVSRNVAIGALPGHGIKVTAGASHIALNDNILLANKGHGIFADAGTTSLTVEGNLIAGNAGSAMIATSSACIDVVRNALVANDQKGVSVSNSLKVTISDNVIADNGGAGVAIARQGDAPITLRDNRFDSNKVGVFGVSSARVELSNNDFSTQVPRLLAGELVQFTPTLLASMAKQVASLTLTAPANASDAAITGYSPFDLQSCLTETN